MLGKVLGVDKDLRKFQVLFLRNNSSDVEVHEVGQVDYLAVQEHLDHGESVFITSRNTQKITHRRQKAQNSSTSKTKMATVYYLDT